MYRFIGGVIIDGNCVETIQQRDPMRCIRMMAVKHCLIMYFIEMDLCNVWTHAGITEPTIKTCRNQNAGLDTLKLALTPGSFLLLIVAKVVGGLD